MDEISQSVTYEEAFGRLEGVLVSLESGDLPLEQALALYEEGAALAAYCARKLEDADLRVRQWQPGGEISPVEGWQEA